MVGIFDPVAEQIQDQIDNLLEKEREMSEKEMVDYAYLLSEVIGEIEDLQSMLVELKKKVSTEMRTCLRKVRTDLAEPAQVNRFETGELVCGIGPGLVTGFEANPDPESDRYLHYAIIDGRVQMPITEAEARSIGDWMRKGPTND